MQEAKLQLQQSNKQSVQQIWHSQRSSFGTDLPEKFGESVSEAVKNCALMEMGERFKRSSVLDNLDLIVPEHLLIA